jgi:hypothetical protein
MEKVVSRVMKTAAKYDSIGKAEFEAILHKIMQQVEKHTSASLDEISALTPKVLADMPKEYGRLGDEDRSMGAMVGYLYGKYLKELGLLK